MGSASAGGEARRGRVRGLGHAFAEEGSAVD